MIKGIIMYYVIGGACIVATTIGILLYGSKKGKDMFGEKALKIINTINKDNNVGLLPIVWGVTIWPIRLVTNIKRINNYISNFPDKE